MFPSIIVPIAVSLLLACVRSISFVCFLLFVSGIFPLQSLPALLRFLYVLSSCFSVFISTIALQKLQVILYPLISLSSTLPAQHSTSLFYHPFLQNSVTVVYFSVILSSVRNCLFPIAVLY